MRILISLMLFSLLSVSAYAAQAPSTANVTLTKNSVQVKTKKADWHPAKKNEPLAVGDQIRTGKGSASEITFTNTGSKVKLGELSQITVESESNDVKLSFGKVFVSVVKGKGGMKIKSPVAVAAVLGTVGAFEFHPTEASGKQYTLTSIDGSFYITDAKGNTATLESGYMANLTPDGIKIEVANIIDLIKKNSDMLTTSFIKVGLAPDSIKINPATGQEVIQLKTADPTQNIEINTTTGDTHTIQVTPPATTDPTSSPTTTDPTASPTTTDPTASPTTASPTTTDPAASPTTTSPTTTSPTTTDPTASPLTTSPTTTSPTPTPTTTSPTPTPTTTSPTPTPAPTPTPTPTPVPTPVPAPTPIPVPVLPPAPPPVLPPTPTTPTTVNMPITIY